MLCYIITLNDKFLKDQTNIFEEEIKDKLQLEYHSSGEDD